MTRGIQRAHSAHYLDLCRGMSCTAALRWAHECAPSWRRMRRRSRSRGSHVEAQSTAVLRSRRRPSPPARRACTVGTAVNSSRQTFGHGVCETRVGGRGKKRAGAGVSASVLSGLVRVRVVTGTTGNTSSLSPRMSRKRSACVSSCPRASARSSNMHCHPRSEYNQNPRNALAQNHAHLGHQSAA